MKTLHLNCEVTVSTLLFLEILHKLRDSSQTDGGLRSRGTHRLSLSHMETCDVTAFRKLYHASHCPQHTVTYDEGKKYIKLQIKKITNLL